MAKTDGADVHAAMMDALAAVRDPQKSAEERRVLVLTAIVTFITALGVSGGTNLVMMINDDPLIKQYKPTLAFASAWIGDGIILPIVNVLIMIALRDWRERIRRRHAIMALLIGFGLMGVFQVVQAKQGMINYTMPKPWNWTWLGYYHMLYMGSQFTFMFYYAIAIYNRWRKGGVSSTQKKQFAIILGFMAVFIALLQFDYS